jgi:hypothetical protein
MPRLVATHARLLRLLGLLVGMGLAFPAASRGDQPAGDPLPPPREVAPEPPHPVTPIPIPAYARTSRYEVWQYYGVDRQGRFRPRVIYSPYGPYYLYNGAPYPFAATHQLEFMPYTVD